MEPFVQHVNKPNSPITAHPTTPQTIPPQLDTLPSHRSIQVRTLNQKQSQTQSLASHTPIPTNNSSQTVSTHPMVTRAKAGIFKLLERMNFHVTTTLPLPCSHVHDLRDPNWIEAMTPVDIESKLGPDGDLISNSTLYRSFAALSSCFKENSL
ncbi:hypothetical protein Tco_0159981, partial [Tanacetum coccineum]